MITTRKRRPKKLRPYTTLLCPHGRFTTWCRRLCVPIKGYGTCGRLAPHAMKDRIQRAISRHKARAEQQAATAGAGERTAD